MVVVAPQQNRGPGLVDTGTLNLATVLGSAPVAGTNYICTAILNATDRDDATLLLSAVTMYLDGAVVWGPNDMHCGLHDRNGNPAPPSFGYGYGGAGKATVRITFSLSRQASIGLDVSTQPMTR